MNYLIGMSHAINIAKAFSPNQFLLSHDNWFANQKDVFYELENETSAVAFRTLMTAIIGGSGFVAGEFIENGRQEIKVHPQLLNLLKSLRINNESDILFSALAGSEHSTLSMIQHPVPYDFVLPTHPTLPIVRGRQILPYSLIETQIVNSIKQTLLVFKIIKSFHSEVNVVHILPPPPISSETQILNHSEVFTQQIAQYGITPASIRLKYYLAYISIMSREAKKLGVDILMPPDISSDSEGFLLEKYWFGATHGNVEYGLLVVDQMNEYYLKRGGS